MAAAQGCCWTSVRTGGSAKKSSLDKLPAVQTAWLGREIFRESPNSHVARLKANWVCGLMFAVAISVALAAFEFVRKGRLRPKGVCIVPGHWLLGNLLEVVSAISQGRLRSFLSSQHQKFGRTFLLKFPWHPWRVMTACRKNVKYIMKTNSDNYLTRGSLSAAFDLVGKGLCNSDGHDWYMQRQDWRRIFRATLFDEHVWVVVCRNARKLLEIVSDEPDRPFDVSHLMNRFTLDTIGEIGFGKCIGSLRDVSSPILSSYDKAQKIVFWRAWLPRLVWRTMHALGWGTEKETREHFGRLDAYSRTVVRELQLAVNQGESSVNWADAEPQQSFLGLFLEDAKNREESLSENFLRDLVMNFLMAGRDPIAHALCRIVHCFSQHPESEAKARKEVTDVTGTSSPGYEDIGKFPYLEAVINESLRLYPPLPLDTKVAVAADTWPDGTLLTRGTEVSLDAFSMGRDESIWGTDAATFRPERWFEMTEHSSSIFQYPVFSAGPRECLGKQLAMTVMKTCLATLLPRVSFQPAAPFDELAMSTQAAASSGPGLLCFIRPVVRKERLHAPRSDHDSLPDGIASQTPIPVLLPLKRQFDPSRSDCDSATCNSIAQAGPGDRISRSARRQEKVDPNAQCRKEKTHASQSDCDSDSSGMTGTSTETDRAAESGAETSSSTSSRRSRRRKSGWTRQRRSKFWKSVREPTPERWLEHAGLPPEPSL